MRKRIAILLAMTLGAGALCGCTEKKVDYVADTQQTGSTAGTLAEQFGDDSWKASLTMPWQDGTQAQVEISAQVSVPEAEQMSVVEVRRYELDEDGKEVFLKGLFGEEVYYFDPEHKQKEDLEELLPALEEQLEMYQKVIEERGEYYKTEDPDSYNGLQENYRECQDTIDYYKQLMEIAPTSYVKAEEFSSEEYLGIRGGIEYIIQFETYREDTENGSPENVSLTFVDMIPKGSDFFDDSWDYVNNKYEIGSREVENLTEEGARNQVEEFLRDSGFSWYVETGAKVVEWQNIETPDDSGYGYVFTFEPGVDGIGFTSLGCSSDYWAPKASTFSDNAYLEIYVTPENGLTAYWKNPVEMISRTDGVKLLELDYVKEIMIGAIESGNVFSDSYYAELGMITDQIEMEALDLVYLRLWNGESEDSYSYVPVWRLSDEWAIKTKKYVMFVNAMDGEVIDTGVQY